MAFNNTEVPPSSGETFTTPSFVGSNYGSLHSQTPMSLTSAGNSYLGAVGSAHLFNTQEAGSESGDEAAPYIDTGALYSRADLNKLKVGQVRSIYDAQRERDPILPQRETSVRAASNRQLPLTELLIASYHRTNQGSMILPPGYKEPTLGSPGLSLTTGLWVGNPNMNIQPSRLGQVTSTPIVTDAPIANPYSLSQPPISTTAPPQHNYRPTGVSTDLATQRRQEAEARKEAYEYDLQVAEEEAGRAQHIARIKASHQSLVPPVLTTQHGPAAVPIHQPVYQPYQSGITPTQQQHVSYVYPPLTQGNGVYLPPAPAGHVYSAFTADASRIRTTQSNHQQNTDRRHTEYQIEVSCLENELKVAQLRGNQQLSETLLLQRNKMYADYPILFPGRTAVEQLDQNNDLKKRRKVSTPGKEYAAPVTNAYDPLYTPSSVHFPIAPPFTTAPDSSSSSSTDCEYDLQTGNRKTKPVSFNLDSASVPKLPTSTSTQGTVPIDPRISDLRTLAQMTAHIATANAKVGADSLMVKNAQDAVGIETNQIAVDIIAALTAHSRGPNDKHPQFSRVRPE